MEIIFFLQRSRDILPKDFGIRVKIRLHYLPIPRKMKLLRWSVSRDRLSLNHTINDTERAIKSPFASINVLFRRPVRSGMYISNFKKFDEEKAVMSVISKKRKLFGVVSERYTAERKNISAITKEKP